MWISEFSGLYILIFSIVILYYRDDPGNATEILLPLQEGNTSETTSEWYAVTKFNPDSLRCSS